jgi:hypothetical protein
MSRFGDLFKRVEAPKNTDEPCPRCHTPAPLGTVDCAVCGWDMREAYHGEPYGGGRFTREAQGERPASGVQ